MIRHDLTEGQPPLRRMDGARAEIAARRQSARECLVVIGDDPTGTQVVHGVDVYTQWPEDALREALSDEGGVFFLSTNSRALAEEEAASLNRDLATRLNRLAQDAGVTLRLASRSDSTLRGHFPAETDALADGLGRAFDGLVLAPAFFEGGRYTVDDYHWVAREGQFVTADETEFARDPAFGYSTAHLPAWVEEKSRGRWKQEDCLTVPLSALREGGPAWVAECLAQAEGGCPIIVNAAGYADLDVFVLGLMDAEAQGRKFLYRCAAPFVKVRAGIPDRPLLQRDDLGASRGPGIVVAGSYVEKSTGQLAHLIGTGIDAVEVPVRSLLDDEKRAACIADIARRLDGMLRENRTAVLFTERERLSLEGQAFLDAGAAIMRGLCGIMRGCELRPAFVVAKGGITSHEIARQALNVTSARVLGQVIPGVPVWRLGPESRWPGIPYVVFPGNVGEEGSLAQVVDMLCDSGENDVR